MVNMSKVIEQAIDKDASDIHLMSGLKPMYRIARSLVEMEGANVLKDDDMYEIYDYIIKGNVEKDKVSARYQSHGEPSPEAHAAENKRVVKREKGYCEIQNAYKYIHALNLRNSVILLKAFTNIIHTPPAFVNAYKKKTARRRSSYAGEIMFLSLSAKAWQNRPCRLWTRKAYTPRRPP